MKRDQRTISVSEIHDTPQRGVFYVTGGGSLFVSDLLTVPGASNTVLEAQVPYAPEALNDMVGGGDIRACNLSSEILGNVATDDWASIIGSPYLQQFKKHLQQ